MSMDFCRCRRRATRCASSDLPGVFGNGANRPQLWKAVRKFSGLLLEQTPIRALYMDGDYISAHAKPEAVEVGIELSDDDHSRSFEGARPALR